VAETVADTLGLRDRSSRMPVPALIEHLAERRLLLILDSCEHLLAGCHEIAETLLKACPGLLVLATSREPLAIMGEVRLPVPALSLPGPGQPGSPARLLHSESGALFAERAAATAPGFTITAENSQAVSELCRRMEGIPQAGEDARTARLPWFYGCGRHSVRVRTAYKCRAYPDQAQQQMLARTFGCVRVVWNRTLAARHRPHRRRRSRADRLRGPVHGRAHPAPEAHGAP
jgi:hypothetical protein